jgi:hypothetical protein
MPPDQRLWFHDGERGTPVNQPGKYDEREPCRIIGPAGSDATLRVECELLPKEEILGRQSRS